MKKIIILLLLAVLYLTVLTCKSINDNGKRLTPKNKHSRLQKMKKPIPVVGVDSMSSNIDQDTAVLEYVGEIIAESRMTYVEMKDYKNATYIDNTESIKPIKNLIKGLIAYSVPDEMTVGENYNVKIRITKDSTQKKTLVIGDNKIPINDTTVQSTITIESIRVSSIMSASLTTDSEENFKIASKSTETQNIEQLGYTEWEWNVMPLKSGEHELKLIIKVRITSEDGEKSFKDIVVFEKNVFAKKNISYSIKNLFNKYWQWSLSTLIIPFIVWLYNRKKKKKEEE
jgi:hypothetical protein